MNASLDGTGLMDDPAGKRRAFVLIPGAGGAAWYWHRVVPLLQEAGHEAIAVDLVRAENLVHVMRPGDIR